MLVFWATAVCTSDQFSLGMLVLAPCNPFNPLRGPLPCQPYPVPTQAMAPVPAGSPTGTCPSLASLQSANHHWPRRSPCPTDSFLELVVKLPAITAAWPADNQVSLPAPQPRPCPTLPSSSPLSLCLPHMQSRGTLCALSNARTCPVSAVTAS